MSTEHESDETDETAHGTNQDVDYETKQAPLINHALQAMLNEHGAEGWELVDVEGDTAHLRRPVDAGARTRWRYATVPLVPTARQAIMDQWTEQDFELVLERDNVGYFKQEA